MLPLAPQRWTHVFMIFLIVLLTSSLYIEMVAYCTSYTNIKLAKLHTGIKIFYGIDKFAFEGNKSKTVRGSVLT